MPKPPLLVHIIFHPASDDARELARTIHKRLNADPAVPGLRVPTVFCPNDGAMPPATYDLDGAERSFVVILADCHVVADGHSGHERTWPSFIGDLWEACEESPHRFFPVQLDDTAWGFDDRLGGTNFVRAFAEPDEAKRNDLVVRRLVIELCRYLADRPLGTDERSMAPVTLFLSHTKLDIDSDPKVYHALVSYLSHSQPVGAWVDSGDIAAGSRFAESITTGVDNSSLLCVLTDRYSTREWCRKEIILAKQKNRPVVVIAAFNRQEVRSFPYLGNLPVLRWPCIPPRRQRLGEGTDQRRGSRSRRGPGVEGDTAGPSYHPSVESAEASRGPDHVSSTGAALPATRQGRERGALSGPSARQRRAGTAQRDRGPDRHAALPIGRRPASPGHADCALDVREHGHPALRVRRPAFPGRNGRALPLPVDQGRDPGLRRASGRRGLHPGAVRAGARPSLPGGHRAGRSHRQYRGLAPAPTVQSWSPSTTRRRDSNASTALPIWTSAPARRLPMPWRRSPFPPTSRRSTAIAGRAA